MYKSLTALNISGPHPNEQVHPVVNGAPQRRRSPMSTAQLVVARDRWAQIAIASRIANQFLLTEGRSSL